MAGSTAASFNAANASNSYHFRYVVRRTRLFNREHPVYWRNRSARIDGTRWLSNVKYSTVNGFTSLSNGPSIMSEWSMAPESAR